MAKIKVLSIAFILLFSVAAFGWVEVITLMSSDNVTNGTTGAIIAPPYAYKVLTCDVVAYGDNITQLGVSIRGSLGKWWDNSTTTFDNTTLGACTFTTSQIANKICTIHIVDKPVNVLVARIDNITMNLDNGTAAARTNNVRVYCGGI